MERCIIYLFLWNALHVSGGSSAHHQELKLYKQHRVRCQNFTATCHCRGRDGTAVPSFPRQWQVAVKVWQSTRWYIYIYIYTVWAPSSISSTTAAGSSKDLTKYPMIYIQFELLVPSLPQQWQAAVKVWQSTRCCIYSFWTPDDGRRNRLKHVQHFTEINKLCHVASRWLYLKIRLEIFIIV